MNSNLPIFIRFFCLWLSFAPQLGAVQPEANQAIGISGNPAAKTTQIQIKTKIDALNANKGIDEAVKAQLLSLYQSAQDNLANLESFDAKTAEFEGAIKEAPDKTKKLRQDIEQAQQKLGKQKIEEFGDISVEELEQRLILEKGKADALDEQIKAHERALALQNERPQSIRQETVAAQQKLDESEKKLANLTENPASKLEAEASQLQLVTLIDSLKAQIKMWSAEANSNPIRVELLKAELDSLKLQKEQLNPVLNEIERLLNERRQQEAVLLNNELTQAEKSISGKHSLIQQATRENIGYSRDLQTITTKIETYTTLNKKVVSRAAEIEADFKSAEKKISLAGLSPVLGKILREQRRNLLGRNQFSSESVAIQDEMALTSLEQFKIEDKLKQLSDLDDYLDGLMEQQVDKAMPSDLRMMIQAELRVLLNSQKELLNKLSAAYTAYLRTLGDFDFSKQQMLGQAKKFADYLDERLLWVPSSVPINAGFLTGLFESIRWFLLPRNGLAFATDAYRLALENKLAAFMLLLGLVVVPKLKRWAKDQLKLVAEKTARIYTDDFSCTLKAFGCTLILVLPLPVLVYVLGWFLSGDPHAASFSKAMGAGLQGIAIPLFALQLFYRVFADDGIAVRHFQWQKNTAHLLRREIAWVRFIIIPSVFVINCTGASPITSHSEHLGRVALILAMTVLSVFFARLLHPVRGLFQAYIKANPDDGFSRLRFVWYPLVVSIPLAIIGFAVAGYYLSALELQQKLVATVRLIFGIVIVYGLAIRWLTLVNRQLAIKNARQKRKTAAMGEKHAHSGGVVGDLPVLPIDEQLVDIPTINAQTIKLLIVFIGFALVIGVWMIWSNILPAFSFLDQVVLWQQLVRVDGQESFEPVTMTNLLMAFLYLFIVVMSVRNFPGMMELLVFSRLSIAPGGRYAVNQLARYLIIAIGFICIANELGGSWSQVQWLVAALSVGLGFGLQEIFANLVSGIILLFERPIRVGDTVTINSVTGTVSRIQMRATTIIDFDHKELIVPNKTFITNQLVNWTLSDTTTRIQIPIAIAYGSDVELAHRIMLETARSTPLVLEEPAASVMFTGIKEYGLEYSVTVFVSELGHRLITTHKLLTALEKKLRENNIDFPYRQHEMRLSDTAKVPPKEN